VSLRDDDRSIAVAEVASAFAKRHGSDYERPITNRYVGSLLRRRLHLRTYKTDGVYVLAMTDSGKLAALCQRYGVDAPMPT